MAGKLSLAKKFEAYSEQVARAMGQVDPIDRASMMQLAGEFQEELARFEARMEGCYSATRAMVQDIIAQEKRGR